MFIGTMKDNTQDMLSKWRHAHGERAGNHVLTDDLVRFIRESVRGGKSQNAMSRELGISRRTIQDALRGITWKHVA
jgi:AraC-like DNA-binding protein